MRSIDIHSIIDVRRAISPQAVADNTPLVSAIIDRQGFEALEFVIATGTLSDADATFAALVEEGDVSTLTDAAAVSDKDLLGTEAKASFTHADSDKVFRIGYRGYKRYVRLTITPSGNAASALISAIAVLGGPHLAPVA